MLKKSKKLFNAILSASLAAVLAVSPVCANGIDAKAVVIEPEIEPQWKNVGATAATLDFDGSTIFIDFTVTAYSGTTFSDGVVGLFKLTGDDAGLVKRWTGLSASTPYFFFTDDSLTATKGTYRVQLSITATRNGVSEVITAKKDRTY